MSRNYRKEYDNYHSKPEQKIRRAARNAARAKFKDADPNKDVHHKDNNPLNNDRNNLSLVTQHYNRREPRLRKEVFTGGPGMTAVVVKGKIVAKGSKSEMRKKFRELKKQHKDIKLVSAPGSKYKVGGVWKEGALVVPNMAMADQAIADKFKEILQRARNDFDKKQKLAKAVGIKVSMRGTRVSVEQVENLEEIFKMPRLNRRVITKSIKAPFININKSTLGGKHKISYAIHISLDKKSTWSNNIYQNSRHATFMLHSDKQSIELITKHYKLPKFRKGKFKSDKDVIAKINKWIVSAKSVKEFDEAISHNKLNKLQKDTAQAIQISGSAPNTFAVHQSADALRTSTRSFQLHFDRQKSNVREIIAKAVNKTMSKAEIFYVWDAKFAKRITAFGEEVNEANAISMSNPNAKRMVGLMQKYINTKDKKKKAALLKDINKYQKMLGLKVTETITKEEMGTVTGTHISGTGDDSSTVKVKKKKKKDVQIRFKLKNQKSLKKRILDNVLAIQQKV